MRNTVPGITPINVTNYSILNIPKKMLFFKVLQSKAKLKIKIHPLVINGLLNPTSLKNLTSSAYLPPEEIFILGLYVLRELDQLHFPLPLKKHFTLAVFLYALSIKTIQPKITNDVLLLAAFIHLALKTIFSKL